MTPGPRKQGPDPGDDVGRLHRVLVESIALRAPAYLGESFTVADIYQSLAPFRSHRTRLGLTLNRDYDDLLLRLLAGEGNYLVLESEPARDTIRQELERRNPSTGIYREFAAAKVHLDPRHLPADLRDGPVPDPPATRGHAPGSSVGEKVAPDPAPASEAGAEGRGTGAAPAPSPGACPACERDLPRHERLKFCPHCGQNTREAPCPQCGEVLSREWRFCIICGARTLF